MQGYKYVKSQEKTFEFLKHKSIMKKIIFALVLAVVALVSAPSASAAKTSDSTKSSNPVEQLWNALPDVLIVKQTATLNNGKSVTIYYKKAGNQCEVYTPSDITGLNVDDLTNLEKSDFSIATSTEGRKVYTAPFSTVRKIVKRAVNSYL